MEGSYTLTQLKDRLGPVFRENRVRKAVLFGSYVRGQATADSDVDILTGHNAGITSIGCVWGFRGRQELESAGADFIAEKAQDIYEIITGRHDI